MLSGRSLDKVVTLTCKMQNKVHVKEIKTWRKFIPGLAFPKGEDCFVIGREIRPTPLVALS